jgi:acetyl/propionyl-CoA carboxylase alpha subunit
MGQAAVKVAKVSGYQNAGTVEFLLDTKGRFYFLEMNARIQVEHPITELVTGVDLVKWQIKIAQGEELTLEQSKLSQRGHAIECRIYAEDPSANFIPCPGRILLVKEPTGPGVRIDGGIKTGDIVTPYYDPILSKLIVWAEDRESARKKMILALEEYVILGITTCLEFLKDIMTHPEFIKAQTFTDFISVNMSDWQERKDPQICNMALQAAAIHLFDQSRAKVDQRVSSPNLWQTIGRWEIGSSS